jgi:hypothetical protein
MHLKSERTGGGSRIDASLLPPCGFVSAAMHLAIITAAQRGVVSESSRNDWRNHRIAGSFTAESATSVPFAETFQFLH